MQTDLAGGVRMHGIGRPAETKGEGPGVDVHGQRCPNRGSRDLPANLDKVLRHRHRQPAGRGHDEATDHGDERNEEGKSVEGHFFLLNF